MAGGWIYFFGAIASTIMAYNMASWFGDKAFRFLTRIMMGERSVTIIAYLDQLKGYFPAAEKFYKKAMIVQSIVEIIVLFFSNMFFLWLFNSFLLQVLITWECGKINQDTASIAMTNALGGAISASVILLVWNLIGVIPFPITKLVIAIESFPFIGWMIVPALLLIFNLAFGAIGKAVALSQGCSAEKPQIHQPEQTKAEGFNSQGAPYPFIDNPYQYYPRIYQHPPRYTACGINDIIHCLPSEIVSQTSPRKCEV